jgi:primosomal protein N' (replication factor Y)
MVLLRGRYRYRFLVNARRSANLQAMLRDWIGAVNFAPGVRVGVDVDPYSFV